MPDGSEAFCDVDEPTDARARETARDTWRAVGVGLLVVVAIVAIVALIVALYHVVDVLGQRWLPLSTP